MSTDEWYQNKIDEISKVTHMIENTLYIPKGASQLELYSLAVLIISLKEMNQQENKKVKKEDIAVGQRIKNIRASLKMNQKTFSKRIGSTVSALSNWENGRNKPNDIMIREIARLGGVSINYLFSGKKEPTSNYLLGQKISSIRLNLGLSQEQFGELFIPNADKSIVSRWELGKSVPNASRLKTISQLSNISIDELIRGD